MMRTFLSDQALLFSGTCRRWIHR